jgi:Activator of Hsp90 ATPase homolog 1-like protein
MMAKAAAAKKTAGISDHAVQTKTGKTWAEWCAVLDKAGAAKWPHKQIAAYLHEELGVSGWWSQMVTVGYEQARGLREKHQVSGGFQISRSKTLAASVSAAFKAWQDTKQRKRWLADPDFTIRKATADRNIRATWIDGRTNVEVYFDPKGKDKCQVVVQHNKLPDAKAGERMKKYWCEQLDALKDVLEN